MQKHANRIGWRIAARLDAGWALKGADTGAGSRCGAGILGKRGRADGVMPEAGPRVADAGWQQPAEIGPDGQRVNVEGGARLTDIVPHERDGQVLRPCDDTASIEDGVAAHPAERARFAIIRHAGSDHALRAAGRSSTNLQRKVTGHLVSGRGRTEARILGATPILCLEAAIGEATSRNVLSSHARPG